LIVVSWIVDRIKSITSNIPKNTNYSGTYDIKDILNFTEEYKECFERGERDRQVYIEQIAMYLTDMILLMHRIEHE
ncbi:MAG: hypothetical protein OYH77_01880, partial [Pseudomonadota bacterium]|nr:hypothetical protein [Pseudomonadota bacterium]